MDEGKRSPRVQGSSHRPTAKLPASAALESSPPAAAEAGTSLASAREAALRLGVTATTLYAWLGLSDRGLLVIRGHSVTIEYFQSGPRGQGRIRIDLAEVERLKDLMRVR